MPCLPGFKSDVQRERFISAATLYQCGAPLARVCGAKLRTGGTCQQLALEGEARCLRHGGPDAARRFRARQKAGLENGSVSPEAWARAEAKRARNALTYAWRKDPRLPGRTIDLGADEHAFVAAAAFMGVEVAALYPAQADWLRWRWFRHQKDRPEDARWLRALRDELPRRIAAAEEAVGWAILGGHDRRTRAVRALKAALRAGGMMRAQAVADTLASANATEPRHRPDADTDKGPLTRQDARPWTRRASDEGWKRRLLDRLKAPKPAAQPKRAPGRPRRLPDGPEELAALAALLREAGPHVRAMFEAIPRQDDQLRFLRDLAEYASAPTDAGAQQRWLGWVTALGL